MPLNLISLRLCLCPKFHLQMITMIILWYFFFYFFSCFSRCFWGDKKILHHGMLKKGARRWKIKMYDVLEGKFIRLSTNWISLPRKLRLDSFLLAAFFVSQDFPRIFHVIKFAQLFSVFILFILYDLIQLRSSKEEFLEQIDASICFERLQSIINVSSFFTMLSSFHQSCLVNYINFPPSSSSSHSAPENWSISVILWLLILDKQKGPSRMSVDKSKWLTVSFYHLHEYIIARKICYASSPATFDSLYMIIRFYCDETGH